MINFFKKKRTHKSPLCDAIDGCLLSQKDFGGRLREERLRSERSGLPLSLVVIDPDKLFDYLSHGNGLSFRRFSQALKTSLKKSTRQSDIKGWYEDEKIALLAPYTNQTGAAVLATNLALNLAQSIGAEHQEQAMKQFITIASISKGRNYLGSGTDRRDSHQDHYRLEFTVPYSKNAFPFSTPTALSLPVAAWPFALEIFTHSEIVRIQLALKRAMDILGALAGILFAAPLMGLIALLIKMTSPGPVLFCQQRLGLLGKPFIFLKFRSMKTDSDPSLHRDFVTRLIKGEKAVEDEGAKEKPVYKITRDPRVTPIGRFLRRSSLDELPQFFNVLKGDMSLVGPRPPIPYECDNYRRWHCRRVLEVKPGITGLWQVSGRSRTTFDDMVRLDLAYARTWNLWLDVKIILKTFGAVLSAEGSY